MNERPAAGFGEYGDEVFSPNGLEEGNVPLAIPLFPQWLD
jgi:hypothetical protein